MQQFQQKRDSYLAERRTGSGINPLPPHSALRAIVRPLPEAEEELLAVVAQQEQWMRGQARDAPLPVVPGPAQISRTLESLDVLFMAIANDDMALDQISNYPMSGRAYDLGQSDEKDFVAGMNRRDRRLYPTQYEYLCHFLINRIRDLYQTRYWRMAVLWEDISEEAWVHMVAAYVLGFRRILATEAFSGHGVWTEEIDIDMAWFLLAHGSETRNRVAENGLRTTATPQRTTWIRRAQEDRMIRLAQHVRSLLPSHLDHINFGTRARNALEGGEERPTIGEVRGSIDEDNAVARTQQFRDAWLAQAERSTSYRPMIIQRLDPTFHSDQAGQTSEDFLPLTQEATMADIEYYTGDDIRRDTLETISPAELGSNKQKQASIWEFHTDPDTGRVTRQLVDPKDYHAHVGPGAQYWRLLKYSSAWMTSLKEHDFTIPFFHENRNGHGPLKCQKTQPLVYDLHRTVIQHMQEQLIVGLPRHHRIDLDRIDHTHMIPVEVRDRMRRAKAAKKRSAQKARERGARVREPPISTSGTSVTGSLTSPTVTTASGRDPMVATTGSVDPRGEKYPVMMGPPLPVLDPRNDSASRISIAPSIQGPNYIELRDCDLQSEYAASVPPSRAASCQIVEPSPERPGSQKRKATSPPQSPQGSGEWQSPDSDNQGVRRGPQPEPGSSIQAKDQSQSTSRITSHSKRAEKRRRQKLKRQRTQGIEVTTVPDPQGWEVRSSASAEPTGPDVLRVETPLKDDDREQAPPQRRVILPDPSDDASTSTVVSDQSQSTSSRHRHSSSRHHSSSRRRSSDRDRRHRHRPRDRSSNDTPTSGSSRERHSHSGSSRRHHRAEDRERHSTHDSRHTERRPEHSHRVSSEPRQSPDPRTPRAAHSYGDLPVGFPPTEWNVIPNRFRDGTINPNVLVLRNPPPLNITPQNRTHYWQPTEEEQAAGYYQHTIWPPYPRNPDDPPPPPGAGGAGFLSQY